MPKKTQKKKSPGGRLLVHKIKKKTQRSYCKICGILTHKNALKGSKSGRHADRPYAGEICHSCLKKNIHAQKL